VSEPVTIVSIVIGPVALAAILAFFARRERDRQRDRVREAWRPPEER
jgi:hypothetical protein